MIVEYDKISENEWKKIGNAIRESNGKALVLVHPFYVTGSKKEMKAMEGVKKEDVLDYLFELQKTLKQWKGPIVVMVEKHKIQTMKEILKHEKRNVIIVPTEIASSIPQNGREWKTFLERLKKEGLKTVHIGGEKYYEEKGVERGCVNGAKRLWSKKVFFEKMELGEGSWLPKKFWLPKYEMDSTGINAIVKKKITFPGKRGKKRK